MSESGSTGIVNVSTWIEENKQFFLPPVCNKMLHNDGQMKLFFVGGPNQRKDFHIDCGEELFLQLKGDMVLKVVERGVHRDVTIKEGEMFLLPGRIEHSPQRFENTVGLVIERDRHADTENDGLRYFVEEDGAMTTRSLYEKWFYCTNLGLQLGPLIKAYFASEQHKTGQPIPSEIPAQPPVTLDTERTLDAPFSFRDWIDNNRPDIDSKGRVQMFDGDKFQFQVYVYGRGSTTDCSDMAEAWIWQQDGQSTVDLDGETFNLVKDDSLLVPVGKRFTVSQEQGSLALVCYQDQTKAATWPQ